MAIPYELLQKFLLSLALGSLIGLEREKKKQTDKGIDFTGIRTFMLVTLLGTVSAYVSEFFPGILAVMLVCFAVMVLAGYILSSYFNREIGMTTELASVLGFFIGVLCYTGPMTVAIIVTIIITLVLSFKNSLHMFVRRIKRREFFDGMKFLIIAFVVLPLIPNVNLGPFEAFNPYEIWLMVVFVSGVSFGGYMLTKFFGTERGITLTGLLGGFASSTAVVTSMAGKSKETEHVDSLVFAAVIASATMFIRVLFEVFVLNNRLAGSLIFPMVSMAVIGYVPSLIIWKHSGKLTANLNLKTPMRLLPALKFGLFYSFVLFISKVGSMYLGAKGVYLASLLSGFADVDAITLFVARQDMAASVAITAITLAATVNTLSKIIISWMFGSRRFRENVALIMGLMVFVGLLFTFMIGNL